MYEQLLPPCMCGMLQCYGLNTVYMGPIGIRWDVVVNSM